MDKEKKYLQEEIRKEFQLERMVLFSDAVFAIIITLMAIEIQLPEHVRFTSDRQFLHELFHTFPYIIAYALSFLYIGITWYQHLLMFSLLKDYDKGLVVRNLIMLFFLGLLPFSVSLVTRPSDTILNVAFYFSIIFLSKGAQLVLQHYIVIKRPQLRINADIHHEMLRFKKSRAAISGLCVTFILVITTYCLIPSPEMKNIAWWWFVPFPFLNNYISKKIEKKNPKSHN
jgi:uncharacterized membrane protein